METAALMFAESAAAEIGLSTVASAVGTDVVSSGMIDAGGGGFLGGLSGLFGNMSWMGAAKDGLGLFGALSSIGSGYADQSNLRANAHMNQMMMKREELMGREAATRVQAAMLDRLASNRARAGASGLSLTSGVFGQTDTAVINDAEDQMGINRDNTETRVAARRLQTRQLEGRADQAPLGGYAKASTSLLTLVSA